MLITNLKKFFEKVENWRSSACSQIVIRLFLGFIKSFFSKWKCKQIPVAELGESNCPFLLSWVPILEFSFDYFFIFIFFYFVFFFLIYWFLSSHDSIRKKKQHLLLVQSSRRGQWSFNNILWKVGFVGYEPWRTVSFWDNVWIGFASPNRFFFFFFSFFLSFFFVWQMSFPTEKGKEKKRKEKKGKERKRKEKKRKEKKRKEKRKAGEKKRKGKKGLNLTLK